MDHNLPHLPPVLPYNEMIANTRQPGVFYHFVDRQRSQTILMAYMDTRLPRARDVVFVLIDILVLFIFHWVYHIIAVVVVVVVIVVGA